MAIDSLRCLALLQKLSKLDISYCSLEGDPLATIGSRLPLLRELKPSSCGRIKNSGLASSARPKIEVLALGESSRVGHSYDELTDSSTWTYQNEVTHDNLLHVGSDALVAALVARRNVM